MVVSNWDRDKRVFKIEYVGRWFGIQFSLPHLSKLQMKIRCHWAYLCSSNSAMEVLSVLFSLFFSKHNICLFRSLQMKSFMVAETFIDGCCSNIDVDIFIRTSQLHRLWEFNTSILKNIPTSAVMHFLSTRWYCSAD